MLLPLGLALQRLDHNVLVILADYAVLFLVAIVVLRWSDRWVLALGAAALTLGSIGYRYGRLEYPEAFVRRPAEFGAGLFGNLHALVLSGPYPLITWLAPFAVGIWLGRRELGAGEVQLRLVLIGGAFAIVVPALSWALTTLVPPAAAEIGWWQLLDDAPHTQTPLWLMSATGSAIAVLGICLPLADHRPRTVAPLVSAGRLAFTWYVVHLLVLHIEETWLRTGTILGTFLTVGVFTAVMAGASMIWLHACSRGPLEDVLRPPWQVGRARGLRR